MNVFSLLGALRSVKNCLKKNVEWEKRKKFIPRNQSSQRRLLVHSIHLPAFCTRTTSAEKEIASVSFLTSTLNFFYSYECISLLGALRSVKNCFKKKC